MTNDSRGGKRKHHELLAWQEAMALVKEVYLLTARFPRDEAYGLTAQARRSAVSVPSNIAEGAGRTGRKEFLQFLSVSRGSLCELETQLLLARELGFLGGEPSGVFDRLERLFGLLGGLMNAVRKKAGVDIGGRE